VYDREVDPVTAFILAGGKSVRMGEDKAFLRLGGCTLLERALELVRGLAGNAWIVGNKGKFAAFGPVIEDLYAERGPLGGIHAALTQTSTDLNLMIALVCPLFKRISELPDYQARETAGRGGGATGRRRPAAMCAAYRAPSLKPRNDRCVPKKQGSTACF
jgi:molybdopterin-guanine dinucleotide biosynthesis protein A